MNMENVIKKHWIDAGLLLSWIVYWFFYAPLDITWEFVGDKGTAILHSAKYFDTPYPSPLNVSLGWLITRIPIDEAFLLSIFTLILFIGTAVCVYLATSRFSDRLLYPRVAMLAFLSSWIVIVQSFKIEPYALVIFLSTAAFTSFVYKRNYLGLVLLSLSLIVHPLAVVTFLPMLISYKRYVFRKWYFWFPPVVATWGVWIYFFGNTPRYHANTSINLLYECSTDNFIFSFGIATLLLIAAIGVGIFPLVLWCIKADKKWVCPLLFVIFVPFAIAIANPANFGWYIIPMPFIAMAIGLGMKYVVDRNARVVVVFSMCLMMWLAMVLLGQDSPTTARQFVNELEQLPPNSVVCFWESYDEQFSAFGVPRTIWYVNDRTGSDLIEYLYSDYDDAYNTVERYPDRPVYIVVSDGGFSCHLEKLS